MFKCLAALIVLSVIFILDEIRRAPLQPPTAHDDQPPRITDRIADRKR